MYIRATFFALILALLPCASARAEFKIGLVLTLSGPGADLGTAIKNSIELARSDEPTRFKNVRFIYEDAQYDAKLAVSAFKKLQLTDHADMIFTWGLIFCQALAPLAQSNKIPLVAECIDPHIGTGRDLVVRTLNTSDEYLAAQTAHLKARNLNRIAVLVAQNSYTVEVLEALKRTLLPGQELVSTESFLPTDADFATNILKLRTLHPDVIGVLLSSGQIGRFYKQAKQLNLNVPTFGTNWFASQSEIQSAEGAMEGAVFAMNAPLPEFVERYKARYGIYAGLAFGAPGYEFARMVGEFFGELPTKPSAAEIVNRLAQAGNRHGIATGDYRFVNHPEYGRYFQFPIVMRQVSGSESKIIE